MTIERKVTLNKIVLDLDGPDGNLMILVNLGVRLAKQLGHSACPRKAMLNLTYEKAIQWFDREFGEYVTLQTSNPELLDQITPINFINQ